MKWIKWKKNKAIHRWARMRSEVMLNYPTTMGETGMCWKNPLGSHPVWLAQRVLVARREVMTSTVTKGQSSGEHTTGLQNSLGRK
jgi:hypothetical protein